jgi:transcriptional regulator with XRE-family HTH domain
MADQGRTARPEVVARALAARELGASLREAAACAGVSDAAVRRWERGKSARAVVAPELVSHEKGRLRRLLWELAALTREEAERRLRELHPGLAMLLASLAADVASGLPSED